MKQIKWQGSSYKDLLAFPKEAKQLMGYNLDRIQRGLDPINWKPMPSVGDGVKEIKVHANNEYRIFYVANVGSAIYVLHAFSKKTQKTRHSDIEIAKERLKQIKRGK